MPEILINPGQFPIEPAIQDAKSLYLRAISSGVNAYLRHSSLEQVVEHEDILDFICDPFPNNPERYKGFRLKNLGVLAIEFYGWDGDHLVDSESGFELKPGSSVVEIHLPAPKSKERQFTQVTSSFEMLARFMQIHDIFPEYIIGFTYDRIASASRRMGFKESVIDVPEHKHKVIEDMYEIYRKKGLVSGEMGGTKFIYQSRSDFLERFYIPGSQSSTSE